MLDVEPDTQERFRQVDDLIHRLDESLRQTQHMFTEHMAQSKQIQAQHSTMISRFDNILMGDGQTHGTLVRMANLEQSTVSLHKRLDEIVIQLGRLSGRQPVAVTVLFTLLSSTVVGLLVALVR